MKRMIFFMFCVLFVFVALNSADQNLGVFANLNTDCIQFINPDTNSVSDPLLKGEFGTGGLLDVVITSDGNTAIVSNFGISRIHFVDISGGFNVAPVMLGDTFTSIFAEDLAITPDDKYVLVTDGGLSSRIIVIDIATQTLKYVKNLGSKDAQAIAITPDGQLALVVDYLSGEIHSFELDRDGYLTFKETQIIRPAYPVNITISPDGQTVIVPEAFRSVCAVFSIDSQHNLVFKEFIPLPSMAGQTCVFSADSTKAYYLSNSLNKGTVVNILNVTGPGMVSASGTSITVKPSRGTGQFFGVDTMAMDAMGNFLYITNPTSFGCVAGVSVLDLTTNTQVDFLPGTGYPTGIAFTTMTSNGAE